MEIKNQSFVTEGESGAMHGMRKSLPTNMRSRRARRDLISVDDGRNRTTSREIIHKDINGLMEPFTSTTAESPLVNGSGGHEKELGVSSLTNGHGIGSR